MRSPIAALHACLAIAWIGAAAWFALGIALAGNAEAALRAQRGNDYKTRIEVGLRAERLRAQLDWEAGSNALHSMIQRLGLPLQARESNGVVMTAPGSR